MFIDIHGLQVLLNVCFPVANPLDVIGAGRVSIYSASKIAKKAPFFNEKTGSFEKRPSVLLMDIFQRGNVRAPSCNFNVKRNLAFHSNLKEVVSQSPRLPLSGNLG
jgi:hypothetical protein